MNSFYSKDELINLGMKKYGTEVYISRNACFYGTEYISIGNNVRIDDFCILSGKIIIGNYVHISAGTMLFAGDKEIRIGDFCAVSSRCAVYATNDDYSGMSLTNPTVPDKYRNVTSGNVVLKKHTIIGSGCTILPDVTIGEGTAVGCMSFVNKSLDDWGIYVGIPCKRIKDREKEMLDLEREFLNEVSK